MTPAAVPPLCLYIVGCIFTSQQDMGDKHEARRATVTDRVVSVRQKRMVLAAVPVLGYSSKIGSNDRRAEECITTNAQSLGNVSALKYPHL